MTKVVKPLFMQSVFIQKLKEVIPPNIALAEEMAEVLEISTDSAYRRMRCETELGIDEVYKLIRKYNVSLDGLFSNLGDTVTFKYIKLTDSAEHFYNYLQGIYKSVEMIASFPEKKVTYMAGTFPLFYCFSSPRMAEFKLFYWQKSVLNLPEYQGKKFEYGQVPSDIMKLAMSIFELFKSVPCTEVWNHETINTNTKQIEFYADSGMISDREVALELLDENMSLVNYLEKCAQRGCKVEGQSPDNFQLYCSDVELSTNCIYFQTGETRYSFVSFNTLNSLNTSNTQFCEEVEHWVRNIVQKSTLISGVSEKQRFQFFSRMRKTIEESKARIVKGH